MIAPTHNTFDLHGPDISPKAECADYGDGGGEQHEYEGESILRLDLHSRVRFRVLLVIRDNVNVPQELPDDARGGVAAGGNEREDPDQFVPQVPRRATNQNHDRMRQAHQRHRESAHRHHFGALCGDSERV